MANGELPSGALPDWVAISVDVDWAPDCAIDAMARRFVETDIPSTWFVTHGSPAIDRLRDRGDLFELGIHPNFLPGSSHGRTPAEILMHCLELVPNATSIRSHSLVYASPLLEVIAEMTDIEVEGSLLMPHAYWARPFEYRVRNRSVVRMPTCWEDDYEWTRDDPTWNAVNVLGQAVSLAVFTLHPIHVALNSASPGPYSQLRARSPEVSRASAELVDSLAVQGEGAGSMFESLLAELEGTGNAFTMTQVASAWRQSQKPVQR